MPHARQQIRDHIATTITGLTTTGARVYNSRVYPSGAEALPGLSIYTPRDDLVRDADTLGARQRYELTVMIEARVKPAAGTEFDEQLDTVCAEVTAAIMADPTLGNRVTWIQLESTESELSGTIERPVGLARMAWVCRYNVLASDPTTLIYVGG